MPNYVTKDEKTGIITSNYVLDADDFFDIFFVLIVINLIW